MKLDQFLLVKLGEECAEVAQRAAKQIQFGKDEVQRGHRKTNARRLRDEINDFMAVVLLLMDRRQLPYDSEPELARAIEAKKAKIKKYARYSRKLGRL